MSSSMKVPPPFKEDEMDYEQWKKDLELWAFMTDLDERKILTAIHFSLNGRARQAASEILISEMKSEHGYKILLEKLDRAFLQDEN